MKTILYQPIFINPQAYFVFPSLYHIEKGDSFIEPANITGQLIINTFTNDPTVPPIILSFCSKYKDNTAAALFKFEWVAGNKEYTSSLGKDTDVVFVDSNITWQTKTSYNGKALTNLQYEDGEHLIIGDYAEKIGNYYIGCHSDFLLFNRTLSEDEINWLKENIYNIEI